MEKKKKRNDEEVKIDTRTAAAKATGLCVNG
jgi:hypothetical protein